MRYIVHTVKERRLAVAKMQGGFYCIYCEDKQELQGQDAQTWQTKVNSLVVDHVVPRRHGGSEDLRNLVLACNTCNIRKLDRDADALAGFGHETLAQRIAGVQAMRADWGVEEVKRALAQPVEGIDPGYDRYEKFITETPTAKVINAALTYAKMSSERLRRVAGLGGWTLDRLRWETQAGSIKMWHRLSEATGYPIDEFLKVYRRWTTQPDTPQRELEYAAARVNLNVQQLETVLGISQIQTVYRGRVPLDVEPTLLAHVLRLDLRQAKALLQRINNSVRPLPLPRYRYRYRYRYRDRYRYRYRATAAVVVSSENIHGYTHTGRPSHHGEHRICARNNTRLLATYSGP